MTADGTVTSVTPQGFVDIEFPVPRRCQGCAGMCLWRRLPDAHRARFETPTIVAVGDRVVVTLPDRYLLLGSLLVYGWPLAALLGGAVTGHAASGTDLGSAAGAVLGVLGAVLSAPLLRRRLEQATLRHLMVRRAAPPDADAAAL